MARPERLDGRGEIAVRALRQASPRSSSASVTPRQADSTTASRGLAAMILDDVGDPPEAVGIGDARAAEFMYDPFIHTSHALEAIAAEAPSE